MIRRSGFTVIELIAALAIGGVTLAIAHASFIGIGTTRRALSSAGQMLDQEGVGFRRVKRSLMMAVSVESGAPRFFGDASTMSFRSRCRTVGGWYEPCDVALRIVARSNGARVEMMEGGGQWDVVLTVGPDASFRYLDFSNEAMSWKDAWGESIARPAAIMIDAGRDSTVFRGLGS